MSGDGGPQDETTLVICKPDAVVRGLVGEVIGRLERRRLHLVRAELRHLDKATAASHSREHEGKPFYEGLIEYITRSPVMVMAVGGPPGTWQVVRRTIGATNPRPKPEPGTIRGDLALTKEKERVHGSDGPESARREVTLFFPDM